MMRFKDAGGEIEYKYAQIEVKATSEGVVEGYASRFGETDQGGDIVVKGAYSQTLKSNRSIKMLWQHDPSQPIGVWDKVKEDSVGLHVKGRILDTIDKGREVKSMIENGVIDGMSIGYRTRKASNGPENTRLLQDLDLWEISMVTFPMLESARVDAMKAIGMDRPEFERILTQNAKFSRSVARALMGGGLDAVKAMQNAGDDRLDELRDLLAARTT